MTNSVEPRSCPQCGLLNERSASACDCGHDFAVAAMRELKAMGRTAVPNGHRIVRIARAYRSLLIFFACTWLLQGGVRGLTGIAALVGGLIVLALAGGMLVMTFRLADGLDLMAPLWTLGMLIPLVNLVLLLVLSTKASRACREAGISVGFLGPSGSVIDDFMRSQA